MKQSTLLMWSQSPSKPFGLAWGLLSYLLFAGTATAQNLDDMKSGVVRITAQVEGKSSAGTGFVVHITGDTAFIVTASRVIEGDSRPQVVFLPEPGKSREARVVGLEGGNAKGLAALAVEGPLPQGLLRSQLGFLRAGRQTGDGEPHRLSKTYGYALGRHSRESERAEGQGADLYSSSR